MVLPPGPIQPAPRGSLLLAAGEGLCGGGGAKGAVPCAVHATLTAQTLPASWSASHPRRQHARLRGEASTGHEDGPVASLL